MALPLHALPALRGGLFALLGATATGALAMVFGEPLPSAKATLALLAIGASGYGLSLRFYLLAQRADAGRGGAASRGVACPRTRARGAGARTCAPPRRRTSRSRTRHDAGGGAQSLAQARANASCPFPCSRRASHASPLRRDRRLDIGAAASLRSLVASANDQPSPKTVPSRLRIGCGQAPTHPAGCGAFSALFFNGQRLHRSRRSRRRRHSGVAASGSTCRSGSVVTRISFSTDVA